MITWNCAINLTSQCFVCKGIKNNWGVGVSLRSDFNLLRNCSFNIAIYVQIPKTDNWIAWFTGTYIFLNDAWKTQGNMNQCNHWNTRWWQDWGVVSLQGRRGQFTLIVIWRFNETKSDPQLSQTTVAMTMELSRWRLAWWWFFHLSHT